MPRASTDNQNLDLQRETPRLTRVEPICEAAVSSKAAARQNLDRYLKALQAGDTLVVWRLTWPGWWVKVKLDAR